MALYVNGQKHKCFVNGQQMSGYVNGVKMFGEHPQIGLRFSGTQYIDSGVAGSDTLTFSLTCKFLQTFGIRTGLLGSRNTTTGGMALFQDALALNGIRLWGYGGSSNNLSSIETPINQIVTITSFPANTRQINGVDSINGAVRIPNPFTDTNTVLIGTSNTANGTPFLPSFNSTIYGCQLFSANVLVRDFVPVKQGSVEYSNVPAPSNCFWDNVTQQYFENQGTGTLEMT